MKHLKRISALLLVLALTFALCGCAKLDEMRAAHGIFQEDGSVSMNGKTYLPIASEVMQDYFYTGESKGCYLSAPDVPVLLSRFFGTYACVMGDVIECQGGYYVDERQFEHYDREHTLDHLGALYYAPTKEDSYAYTMALLIIDDAVAAALQSDKVEFEGHMQNAFIGDSIFICDAEGEFARPAYNIWHDQAGGLYRDDPATGTLYKYGSDDAAVISNFLALLDSFNDLQVPAAIEI